MVIKAPISEKVESYFEDHTDIIVKSRREVQYGHKVFLSSGKSNLILDCLIERGNPADSEQFIPMLKRHQSIFGYTVSPFCLCNLWCNLVGCC